MRIGIVQTHPVFGEPAANLSAVERALAGAQPGADLWVIPELFATGYVFGSRAEVERLAEPVPDGPTTRGLVDLARARRTSIVAGVAERAADGRFHNSCVAVDPAGGVRALYRKTHLFDFEKEWFDPGDTGFMRVDLAGARVGLMICFDWRFPEAARTLTLMGAQVIAHPSNLVHPHCQEAMVTRALENGVFVVTANRIGTEARAGHDATFTGRSRIIAPGGKVLAEGPVDRIWTGAVEIDPSAADNKFVTEHNDLLADRRPEFYRS